jgi:hypothetical protein
MLALRDAYLVATDLELADVILQLEMAERHARDGRLPSADDLQKLVERLRKVQTGLSRIEVLS